MANSTGGQNNGKVAYLVLEDGSVYQGKSIGAEMSGHGEVVFNPPTPDRSSSSPTLWWVITE